MSAASCSLYLTAATVSPSAYRKMLRLFSLSPASAIE